MYYLFAFRSRTNAMKFAQSLKKEGIKAEVVATPHVIANGCGLSVRVMNIDVARRVLSYSRYATFTGLYQVRSYNGTLNITKL